MVYLRAAAGMTEDLIGTLTHTELLLFPQVDFFTKFTQEVLRWSQLRKKDGKLLLCLISHRALGSTRLGFES